MRSLHRSGNNARAFSGNSSDGRSRVRRVALFAPIYSDEQRDSIAAAIVECRQGVKVARDAVRLAAAGELESVTSGERLEAFEIPLTTAQALARDERKRRSGEAVPEWIRGKGTDAAIDELAVRLVAIASHELTRIERQRADNRDLDRARKAGQVLREARALVRGDAPKQGSAQRGARRGEAPTDGSAASGAAGLVQDMREHYSGEASHENGESPDEPMTETNPEGRAHTHESDETTDETGSRINTGAGSAQDARERMRAELGIAGDGANPDGERDT